jgi:hypothetical protein
MNACSLNHEQRPELRIPSGPSISHHPQIRTPAVALSLLEQQSQVRRQLLEEIAAAVDAGADAIVSLRPNPVTSEHWDLIVCARIFPDGCLLFAVCCRFIIWTFGEATP